MSRIVVVIYACYQGVALLHFVPLRAYFVLFVLA